MKMHLLNKINYLLQKEEHKNVIGNNARRLHNSNSREISSKSLKEYARV